MSVKQVKKLYRDGLDKQTSERYAQKCNLIGGKDPYDLVKGDLTSDVKCLPAVSYIDIINYLVNTKSAYTMDELKAYKSLEAYNQFVCGWVRDVMSMNVGNKVLVTARVRHSQRMNETALRPWVIVDTTGVVDTAHCDCMAGLGEACSHVGSLLFYLEAAARINASKTVTQEKAHWLLPRSIDKVPYSMISDIDFTSAETKKKGNWTVPSKVKMRVIHGQLQSYQKCQNHLNLNRRIYYSVCFATSQKRQF
ncbi:uncharacterized protein LOC128554988 [Mercenaria mercenaria]|uniref:uncharacterized protein LOC128554988 n=1 Tax=Mercenaria mercenaria TaxID=6596 RepID=UPI00234F55D3|nr:uncharacterized protein LOC128554988 [Mercenaria mercenaria]